MKLNLLTTIFQSAAVFVAVAATTDQENLDIFGGAPTKSTPVQYNGITYGHFVSLMEQGQRNLQGFANDPSACTVTGVRFTCNSPSTFSTSDGNVTDVTANINCLLNDNIGPDFQESEDCQCQALFDQRVNPERPNEGNEQIRQRTCACSVCPKGDPQAVALDCTVVPNDPFILGPCSSLDCYGRCNSTGAVVLNLPSPAPQDEGTSALADSDSAAYSGIALTFVFSAFTLLFV